MNKLTIKELRTQTGMSQRRFAERFGIPVRTLQEWEQERREPPDYVVAMVGRILQLEAKENSVDAIHPKIAESLCDAINYYLTADLPDKKE